MWAGGGRCGGVCTGHECFAAQVLPAGSAMDWATLSQSWVKDWRCHCTFCAAQRARTHVTRTEVYAIPRVCATVASRGPLERARRQRTNCASRPSVDPPASLDRACWTWRLVAQCLATRLATRLGTYLGLSAICYRPSGAQSPYCHSYPHLDSIPWTSLGRLR